MNAISKLSIAAVFAFSSAATATAMAQETGHGAQAAHSGNQAGVAGELVDGEVKKVDKEAGKITIRHGELKALGMPAMTMVFRAKDPAMLSQVKVGDKIKFMAEKVDGAITLVHLESAK